MDLPNLGRFRGRHLQQSGFRAAADKSRELEQRWCLLSAFVVISNM
jgi:hypothetical protein